MTNAEIDQIIARHCLKACLLAFSVPSVSWAVTAVTALGGLAFGSVEFLELGASFAALSIYATYDANRSFKKRENYIARIIWEILGATQTFGTQLTRATRKLGSEVQKVYETDPAGELFPLRQAIRLVDTHRRQQERFTLVEARLQELRLLKEALSGKLAQLQELGEIYPEGARNLEQITDDMEVLRRVHGQIHSSCVRLEMIVISVQNAAQARQLRRELDGLSARVPRGDQAIEPAFEAESLDDIERQIGREIETYLQLERETEAHLR